MKWKVVDRETVPIFRDILFTDGVNVFAGFLETCQPEEDLSFFDCFNRDWPDHITHWMLFPKPPLSAECSTASLKQDDSQQKHPS